MPEGDTIFNLARTLHDGLAGQTVARFRTALPALARIDADHPLAGRGIESVRARGKHLLITFSGDLVLHTHLRMNGSWHLYRAGERWRRPARDMRIALSTADAEAVAFNVPVAEFLTARQLARHDELRHLGPDLLDDVFDLQEAAIRVRGCGAVPIADALLNQRVVAGIGNVLKSETLFVAGVHPFTPVADLPDASVEQIMGVARRLIRMNVGPRAAGAGRRTVNALNPRVRLWVYGRGGQPCRRCGATIASRKTGFDARVTYWCPGCQPQEAKTPGSSS